jgi:hypothetical protein
VIQVTLEVAVIKWVGGSRDRNTFHLEAGIQRKR